MIDCRGYKVCAPPGHLVINYEILWGKRPTERKLPEGDYRYMRHAELEFIRENFTKCGCCWCAKKLHRNTSNVYEIATWMGLDKYEKKQYFTDQDQEFIRANYAEHGARYCANILGKARHKIISWANHRGILYKGAA